MRQISFALLAAALYSAAAFSSELRAQTLLSAEEAARSVAVEKLEIGAAGVSGFVVNKTPHVIRDVEVLVQYHWLWENEFKPGADSPGQTAVVRVDRELQPQQAAPFRHSLAAGTDRKDGRFAPEVTIGAFTVVVPAQ